LLPLPQKKNQISVGLDINDVIGISPLPTTTGTHWNLVIKAQIPKKLYSKLFIPKPPEHTHVCITHTYIHTNLTSEEEEEEEETIVHKNKCVLKNNIKP
jgi:hypothetical protein